jgi:sodium-dependent dicarboxylate transporter 2/3/5
MIRIITNQGHSQFNLFGSLLILLLNLRKDIPLMADSRRASKRKIKNPQFIVESQMRLIQFMGCILASLLFTSLVSDETFSSSQTYVLFLLFFSIGLWITEAIPPFAVGIMIVGFLVFFLGQPGLEHNIDVTRFVNTWSDSVIWLLLGGFFLAEGLKKTGLDVEVFKVVTSRFGGKPSRFLLVLMLATGAISMIMSNTATTAMMFAALLPLIQSLGKENGFAKSLLLGIPAAASIGGMGTIIGSPPNAIAVDMINRIPTVTNKIGFLDWMILGLPLALVLIIVFWFILKRNYEIPLTVDLSVLEEEGPSDGNMAYMGNWDRQRVMWIVLIGTVLLWLTDGLHPIPMAAVSGIPIIVLTMMNIIGAEDVRGLPWDTLMLVAGGLSLGLAIQETGLMDFFLAQLQDLTLPMILLIITFAIVTVFSSNVMSNTAAAAILIPAAALWEGVNPMVLPLIIGLSASCALFLPVSTPPNAIAYSTGLIDQNEFRLGGVSIGLLGPVLVSVWVLVIVGVLF